MLSSMSADEFRDMLQEGYAAGYLANDAERTFVTQVFRDRYVSARKYLKTDTHIRTLLFSVLNDLRFPHVTNGAYDPDHLQSFIINTFVEFFVTKEHRHLYMRFGHYLDKNMTPQYAPLGSLMTIALMDWYFTEISGPQNASLFDERLRLATQDKLKTNDHHRPPSFRKIGE